jgi:hypothetical protein
MCLEQGTLLHNEIRRQWKWLRKKLKAREAAREMFLKGALGSRELVSILNANELKAAEMLLNIVLEHKEHEIHQSFLEALQQTEQNDVCNAIIFRGWRH